MIGLALAALAALLLSFLWVSGAAEEVPVVDAAAEQLKSELTAWGTEYNKQSDDRKFHEQGLKNADTIMHQLACKALGNRIALCQRGEDSYCKEEATARASMEAKYGAPFESVCQKSFTKQATGS